MARSAKRFKRILLNCAASAVLAPVSFAFADAPISEVPHYRAAGDSIEIVRERYTDGAVKIEREVTQDADRNYVNHGSWKMFDPSGTRLAEGTYHHDQRHGVWNRWYRRGDVKVFSQSHYRQFSAPFVSQAHFDEGKIDGPWVILDARQHKVCEVPFVDGLRHGTAVWYFASGKPMRTVEYSQGIHHGDWIEYAEDGKITTRHLFQQGRRLASKVERFPGGAKKTEGVYLFAPLVQKTGDDWWNAVFATYAVNGEDVKHGPWTVWHKNGKVALTGKYVEGLPSGEFTWWHTNGQESLEGRYDEGKQVGEWTWWHSNGQKQALGWYEDGHPSGDWIAWREDGRIVQASEYSDDSAKAPEAAEPSSRGASNRRMLDDRIKPIR